MINNDILRRLRYALDMKESTMAAIFRLSGKRISPVEISSIMKKEDEEGFRKCTDRELEAFLDGLIINYRGLPDNPDEVKHRPGGAMDNNVVLRKLRIAMNYRDEEMLDVFNEGGFELSKPELSALFRKKGHKHYKPCGDQVLKRFLSGLAVRLKKDLS